MRFGEAFRWPPRIFDNISLAQVMSNRKRLEYGHHFIVPLATFIGMLSCAQNRTIACKVIAVAPLMSVAAPGLGMKVKVGWRNIPEKICIW